MPKIGTLNKLKQGKSIIDKKVSKGYKMLHNIENSIESLKKFIFSIPYQKFFLVFLTGILLGYFFKKGVKIAFLLLILLFSFAFLYNIDIIALVSSKESLSFLQKIKILFHKAFENVPGEIVVDLKEAITFIIAFIVGFFIA